MHIIGHLWMPVLVATVVCFILSALFWMIAPHHKGEWQEAPDAENLRKLLRAAGAKPGAYTFPHMSEYDRKDKNTSAEKMKQWAEGPSGVMYIVPQGPMNMGAMMGKQFAFFLLINALLGLITAHILLLGAEPMRVAKFIGAIAFMTYGLGSIPDSIWFGRPWRNMTGQIVDAAIYAAATAAVFGSLWPH
ncbi:MAG TPA: hypothetical protein VGI92_03340 [Gemmatimonadales bacterium]|jgi:hypothetical protein